MGNNLIYRKGDKKGCSNYSGLIILNAVVTKEVERIIERKLRLITEETLSLSQSGFRKGKSITIPYFCN